MNGMVMSGVAIVLLGLLGLALPIFTTQKTEDVAHIGSLNLQTTESTPHTVSPFLSGGAVLVGIFVIGAGVRKRT